MKNLRFATATLAAALVQLAPLHAAASADMGKVGNYMSRIIQNAHFERPPFMEMSQRFLDDYVSELDPVRMFFLQSDIDRFNTDYGTRLSDLLLSDHAPEVAEDIYGVYRKRVEARIAETKRLLDENKFDFTKDEFIPRDRKDAAWPKNETDAMAIWKLRVKDAVLSETLRRDILAKRAAEKGKPDPSADDKSIAETIAMRDERLLHRVTVDSTPNDISSMLLNAVAMAFDPHSNYMAAPEMGRFKDDMRNELVGIGAELRAQEEGSTKIMGIIKDGPADKQGQLLLNDSIIAVDSDGAAGPEPMVDVMFMDVNKVVDLIRGDRGSSVTLKVTAADVGPGDARLIEIVRDTVEIKSSLASAQVIKTKDADGDAETLGIITLPSFYVDFDGGKAGCADDVALLLHRLVLEEIDGLIFDLRGNGGGSLEEVLRMTGLFTGEAPVSQVKDSMGRVKVLKSGGGEPIYTGPMVVLTDKASASASEILAGALQDTNRAVIVGQSSTFGKGTVQQTLDIGQAMPFFTARDKAGTLKLTIQKFYRPSGSSTQHMGVVPDIVLPNAMDAFEFGESFMKHPLEHDFIKAAADLKPFDRDPLGVPRLKELSDARVKDSKDFAYLNKDIELAKKHIRENKVSLNAAVREKEIAEIETDRQARNIERKARFAETQKRDRETMEFFDVSVDEAATGKPLVAVDPSSKERKYVRTAKDEDDDTDTTPDLPSGLDIQKREGLLILQDMVAIGRGARVAGAPKPAEVR